MWDDDSAYMELLAEQASYFLPILSHPLVLTDVSFFVHCFRVHVFERKLKIKRRMGMMSLSLMSLMRSKKNWAL